MSKLNVANRVGRWIAGVAGLVAFASVACATETLIDRTCSGACAGAVYACARVSPGKCENSTHRLCEP
jgi:hypothetical protein